VLSTVDPAGKPVDEAELPATRAVVRAYFTAHPGPHRAVVESTATWYWLRDLLVPLGVDLRLGHSKYIKAIRYAKVKTDAVDAHTLAQYNVTRVEALPPLVQLRVDLLAQQRTLLTAQIKQIERELAPRLVPTPDAQRLLYIPGIGAIVAFTLLLEIDTIARFPTVKDFVSYCRLVPAAKNSAGKQRQQRSKDGNRYAAIRAIQYCPEIQRFYRSLARRKPPAVARALVAKELARAGYFVLSRQEPFNGTFKGQPLSRTKTPKWPRLVNPPA
jgi:transposase